MNRDDHDEASRRLVEQESQTALWHKSVHAGIACACGKCTTDQATMTSSGLVRLHQLLV